jgi:hypothetical protein
VRRRPLALATGNEATDRPAFGGTALTTYGSAGGIGSRTGGGRGLVGMGSGHSLGTRRRVGPGMLVGTFQRTPWPHSPPSPRWEPAFKECCIPPGPIHSASCGSWTAQRFPHWESCRLSLEKSARKLLGTQTGRPRPVTSWEAGVVRPVDVPLGLL